MKLDPSVVNSTRPETGAHHDHHTLFVADETRSGRRSRRWHDAPKDAPIADPELPHKGVAF